MLVSWDANPGMICPSRLTTTEVGRHFRGAGYKSGGHWAMVLRMAASLAFIVFEEQLDVVWSLVDTYSGSPLAAQYQTRMTREGPNDKCLIVVHSLRGNK